MLPFSRRVVDIPSFLWPRSEKEPPPEGFTLCGCAGCENKTADDHIFKEDDDDEVSAFGNIHIDPMDYIRYDDDDE